jgi:hypothetical protein
MAIQKSLCELTRLIVRDVMNDEYFKQQADRVRAIADKADPFTRTRLLELAKRYDAKHGKAITGDTATQTAGRHCPDRHGDGMHESHCVDDMQIDLQAPGDF